MARTAKSSRKRKFPAATWHGWILSGKGSGAIVYHGNVPALYWERKEAWYDGSEEIVPRKVRVRIEYL